MLYPAHFERLESGRYIVTFRDVPECNIQGEDYDDALEQARSGLVECIGLYFENRKPAPLPSAAQAGEVMVELPDNIFLKVLLLNSMLQTYTSQAELARLMGLQPQRITRMLDPHVDTKINTLSYALTCLGRPLQLSVANA